MGGATTVLTFSSTGLPSTNSGSTFRYCDERGISSLRAVIVGPSGMVRSAIDGKDHEGNEIVACT
jgi:hypothetical protein